MKGGTPSLIVCSTSFAALGRAQARNLGYPELPVLVVPHPFGSKTPDEVAKLAAWCADEIAKLSEAAP